MLITFAVIGMILALGSSIACLVQASRKNRNMERLHRECWEYLDATKPLHDFFDWYVDNSATASAEEIKERWREARKPIMKETE